MYNSIKEHCDKFMNRGGSFLTILKMLSWFAKFETISPILSDSINKTQKLLQPWLLARGCKLNSCCICSFHPSWIIVESSQLKKMIECVNIRIPKHHFVVNCIVLFFFCPFSTPTFFTFSAATSFSFLEIDAQWGNLCPRRYEIVFPANQQSICGYLNQATEFGN